MPAWLISVSVVASVMMVIPVVTVAINHHLTMVGHFGKLRDSPTLRFIVFGAMSYTAVSLQGSSMALRSLNEVTHFTHYSIGHAHLGLYAFFTMTLFGSMYFIVPRLALCEWPSARLIRIHFWATAVGIIAYFGVMSWGGVLQGLAMNNPDVPFLETVALTKPYLLARTLSGFLIAVGHVALMAHFFWILARHWKLSPRPDPLRLRPTTPSLAGESLVT
jgi:cytochrome c oxidase cbb3-type subunit I